MLIASLRRRRSGSCVALLLALACKSETSPAAETGGTSAADDDDPSSPDDDDDDDSDPSSPDSGDTTEDDDTSDPTDPSDPDPSNPTTNGSVDDDGGDGEDPEPPPANEPNLPSITGTCPDLTQTLEFQLTHDLTFAPDTLTPRVVRLFMDENVLSQDGPVVYYWHGTGGNPNEAIQGLGQDGIAAIRAAGGIVVAPFADEASGMYPWTPVGGNIDHDNLLADEVIACAMDQVGIDPHRIHSVGFSAGGIHTVTMSTRRAAYLASVVSYSGGEFGAVLAADSDPDNLFAAMSVHGGPDDVYEGAVSFQEPSEHYAELLQASGRFALLCDHGQGHSVPASIQASVVRFFADHPWGTTPSPYALGLPSEFPDGFCVIP
jgi:predicted esterase